MTLNFPFEKEKERKQIEKREKRNPPTPFGRQVNSLSRRASSNFQQSPFRLAFSDFLPCIDSLPPPPPPLSLSSKIKRPSNVNCYRRATHRRGNLFIKRSPPSPRTKRERARVHHRIFPSKDAGPLAFNADASFPLIPRDLSPTTIHSRPATFCSSRRRRRRSHLSPFVPRQDPVVAQKDYPSCSRGYSLRSKGLRVG